MSGEPSKSATAPRRVRLPASAVLAHVRISGASIEDVERWYRMSNFPGAMEDGHVCHMFATGAGELVMWSTWISREDALAYFDKSEPMIRELSAEVGAHVSVRRTIEAFTELTLCEEPTDLTVPKMGNMRGAFVYAVEFAGEGEKTYETLARANDFPEDFPSGLLLHFAGECATGWNAVGVWTDADTARQAMQDRFLPGIASAVSLDGNHPELNIRELEVHTLVFNHLFVPD